MPPPLLSSSFKRGEGIYELFLYVAATRLAKFCHRVGNTRDLSHFRKMITASYFVVRIPISFSSTLEG